ncbi:MAG: beta-hydroxyacyl-ACP dehydratase [Planctomycetes bacterium]|nr:beta-hydroxyacyl-ACP dehydratase [Planctomycetota bacterium]
MPPQSLFDMSKIDLDRILVDKDGVYSVNPHRHEFALLDGFCHLDLEAQEMAAWIDMKDDAFWVRGHIPGRPLFPGVLMIEAAAQMIGYFAKVYTRTDGFIGFGAVTDVKFRGQVSCGDRLLLIGKMQEIRGTRRAVGAAQGYVNGSMVFEGCVTGMMI